MCQADFCPAVVEHERQKSSREANRSTLGSFEKGARKLSTPAPAHKLLLHPDRSPIMNHTSRSHLTTGGIVTRSRGFRCRLHPSTTTEKKYFPRLALSPSLCSRDPENRRMSRWTNKKKLFFLLFLAKVLRVSLHHVKIVKRSKLPSRPSLSGSSKSISRSRLVAILSFFLAPNPVIFEREERVRESERGWLGPKNRKKGRKKKFHSLIMCSIFFHAPHLSRYNSPTHTAPHQPPPCDGALSSSMKASSRKLSSSRQ